ncbi:MAG: ROK family transcriptional regulator [Chloroflexi bacterium]|nr:ROK family transcriptional regulator [Chloroflexota bacterium]
MTLTFKGDNFSDIRERNASQILRAILHNGSLSRRHITHLTGLAPGTISNIVNRLIEEGLLEEVGINGRPSGRRGAPEVLVDLNPHGAAVFAMGLGMYSLKVALVGPRGQTIRRATIDNYPTPLNAHVAIEWAVTMAGKMLQESGLPPGAVVGTGVLTSDLIPPEPDATDFAPFSIWHGFPILKVLQEHLGVPAILSSGAYGLALKEVWFGHGRNADHLVCLFLSSSVECSIVSKYRGVYNYAAGNIGHITVCQEGQLCRCGRHGCLETIAGDLAVASAGMEAARHRQSTRLLELADHHQLEHITAPNVARASQDGDGEAARILAASARALAMTLAPIIALHNPQVVVLSGNQPLQGGEAFLLPFQNTLQTLVFGEVKKLPLIVCEIPGPDSPDLIRAVAALDRFLYSPQLDARGA